MHRRRTCRRFIWLSEAHEKNWSVIEEGRCILHGNRSSFGETATKKENNKEWELLEEFLAKAQGTREEGLE